jgi:hypothetical protein
VSLLTERRKYAEFWLGNLREREYLEDLDVDGRIIKMGFQAIGCPSWTELTWLRIRTGGMALKTRELTSGFRKTLRIAFLAQEMLASKEELLYEVS